MDKEFEQRVQKELGEEINPAYVESLLKKDIPALFAWMNDNLRDTQPTVLETIGHAQSYQDENDSSKPVLLFGIKILEKRFKLALFVLDEIRSRINAKDVPPEE